MEVVGCKVGNAKGEVNILFDGLRRNTLDSYVSIQHDVDQTFFAVGSHLKDLTGREAQEPQQKVHGALRDAEGCVQELFVEALEVVDRSSNLFVGHAGNDE